MLKRVIEAVKDGIAGKPLKIRSAKWDGVRDHHIKNHPSCAACASTTHLQVHHIIPFHIDSSKELDPSNLITLCAQHPTNCHLNIGHHGKWKSFNQNVVQEAAQALAKLTLD